MPCASGRKTAQMDSRSEARRVVEVMELLNAVGVERILLLSLEAES